MKKYRATASSQIRIEYGWELALGLRLFPETAGFAPALETVTEELETATATRLGKRKPLVKARVALRFANWQTDQLIRSASRAAEIADGGSRGPIHAAAFPDGLAAVVAPAGARQVKPTEELVARITKSKLAQIEAYRTEWGPKLEASLAALRTAAGAYEAARKDLLDVFQTELALRDEHRLAVERLLGQVRTAFPGDTSKRDLVFPVLDDAVPSDPAADDEPVQPTPAG